MGLFFCRPAQTTSIAFFSSSMENNIVDMELVDYRLCPKVVSGRPNGISRNICHESRGWQLFCPHRNTIVRGLKWRDETSHVLSGERTKHHTRQRYKRRRKDTLFVASGHPPVGRLSEPQYAPMSALGGRPSGTGSLRSFVPPMSRSTLHDRSLLWMRECGWACVYHGQLHMRQVRTLSLRVGKENSPCELKWRLLHNSFFFVFLFVVITFSLSFFTLTCAQTHNNHK